MRGETNNMRLPLKTMQKRSAKGFSLLELLIVTGAMAVATAMAVPVLLSARRAYQLRTATVDLASFLQRARINCVQQNRVIPIRRAAGNTQVYLDSFPAGAPNGQYDVGQGEPMIQLPANITALTAGPVFPAATLGFAAPQAPPARFNGRGLPCAINAGGVCSNFVGGQVGFVYYLSQNINGVVRWSAVSITPGGQVKTWSYSGTTWSNN